MKMSPAALRFGSLFSILTPASKLFANPSVGSAQDVKIDTVQPDPAHRDVKMPVRGDLFRSLDSGSGASSVPKLRIKNLTEYIKTLQAK